MENPDLYNWLTGQKPVPGDVRNPLLRKLCADLRRDMVRPAPPSRHTARGATRRHTRHYRAAGSLSGAGTEAPDPPAQDPKLTVHSTAAFEGKVWE